MSTPHRALITTCAACGAKNRVPYQHLSDLGKCGSCKEALRPRSVPIDVTDAELFQGIIESAKVPVLVDFWADWCGPCKMVAPEVHKVAAEMAGKALVLKVDTEAHPTLAAKFRIQSIPNFIVFRNGKPVHQQPGVTNAATLRSWLL